MHTCTFSHVSSHGYTCSYSTCMSLCLCFSQQSERAFHSMTDDNLIDLKNNLFS